MEETRDGKLKSTKGKRETSVVASSAARLSRLQRYLGGSAFDVRLRLEFMIRESLGSERLWWWGDINSVWPLLLLRASCVRGTRAFEAIWLLNVNRTVLG